MKNKRISKLLILLGCALFLFLIAVATIDKKLIQKQPENNAVITDRQPLFVWEGNAKKISIDDSQEFTSPLTEDVTGNSYQPKEQLEVTTYYWKLFGKKESKQRKTVAVLRTGGEGGGRMMALWPKKLMDFFLGNKEIKQRKR